MMHISPINAIPGLWRIEAETVGYLLVRGGRSLLIDCPDAALAAALRERGLPLPEIILHTQVQDEHCREYAAFPQAAVYVWADSRDVAECNARYDAECKTIWPPSREWDSRGEEKYGVAGCSTERPPQEPLAIAGTLTQEQPFRWEDIELDVLPLPGHNKRSIGLYWRAANVLFSGDLLYAGGYLVNLYDLERSYGNLTGYEELRHSLRAVLDRKPDMLLPATGPVITAPARDIAALQQRLAQLQQLPVRRNGQTVSTPLTPRREFGRYKEVVPGIYQNTNFGNIILYVDHEGRGLMVDPDPCVWLSWEENCREVHADLDLLEQETGLRQVELALITHYHGDHVQYCDLLRERYGTKTLATPDVAALMERPQDYRYPCVIDWYGFPFDHVKVDERIAYETTFLWHDITVTPIHTPGHCYAHTGYVIPWRGLLTTCVGDTLQYNAGPLGASLPVLYNDTAWPDRGYAVTFRRLREVKPDLVLGGHSHSFFPPDDAFWDDYVAVAEDALPIVANLLPDGNLLRAMTPPGFDEKRPSRELVTCGAE